MRLLSTRILGKVYKANPVRYLNKKTNMTSKIAVCQMTSVADKVENMKVVSKLVDNASKEGAQMIFFPEACDYLCDNKQDIVRLAEPIIGGDTVGQYRELAAKHKVWLSMGGVHEKDDKNPGKMYNTHVIINSTGDVVQTYRKLHLFDVEIPERNVRLKESDFCQPGEHVVTPVDTPVGKIGMAICYDMRFPELGLVLSSTGADIITYPSAFTKATGQAHWHVLLRARAIENQCYIVAAAQMGDHNPKRQSYGHAVAVDPWGEVLADCGDSAPAYNMVDISQHKLLHVRRSMPVAQHRRRDVYSLYTLKLRNTPLPGHGGITGLNRTETGADRSDTGLDRHKTESDRIESGPTNVFGHVRVPHTCVFYKTRLTYAFVNLRCVIPGHVLVAPIRLAERNKDLTREESDDFYRTIVLVQKLMERVHNTESSTVTIQDGPDAGQTVKHLHCHIMPRKKGDFIDNDLIYLELAKHDQYKLGHPAKPARSLEEMESEAESLRREMEKLIREEDVDSCNK